MITAKEQAEELFNKYEATIILNSWCDENTIEDEINSLIKQCALNSVDEIIAELDSERVFERIYFWNEVKEEIKLL